MKKFFAITIMMALAISAFAYDFSAVCESGQTLYYRILATSNHEVTVTQGDTRPVGDLMIPEFVEYQGIIYSVTSIDEEAFSYCHGITSVILSNTITTIGNQAFSNITGLSDFILSNSVNSIGNYVFEGTHNIMNDIYNDKIFAYHPRYDQSSFSIPEGIEEIASAAFRYCDMSAVSIPTSVTRIGKGAFSSTSFLQTVTVPDGVTCIDEDAFSGSRIHTITIPPSVTSIKREAFYNCEWLDTIVLPDALQSIGESAFRSCRNLNSIIIPNSVTTIEKYAFANCRSLTSFVLPNSVTNMEPYVFEDCEGLTEPVYNCHYFAYFPKDYATSYTIPEGVETILERVFWECTSLDSITIPNSVKTIGQQAFLMCESLTYVSLPESLKTIGYGAFEGCRQLTTINLPNSVTHIGNYVFWDCDNLTEPLFNDRFFVHFPKNYVTTYSIPEGIEEVISGSFVDCDSLVSVNFPISVTKIRDYAISNCPNLIKININSNIPPVIDLNPFYPWEVRPADAYIYVPAGTLETYLNDQGWTSYFWCLKETGSMFPNREMYYEILNDDGSITYQHLECVGDTLIDREGKRPKVIVRSNTHYDRGTITEVTHEYVYEEEGFVYWWNKDLEEFTTLYNFNANAGDEWEIKVGMESLTMHVDAEETIEYEGRLFRMLHVSDPQDLFSGNIICGIGHLTSFFPEKLMTQGKSFRVEGLRCYWMNGRLALQFGGRNCDEIYEQWHEVTESQETAAAVYPNPTHSVLYVETACAPSLPIQTYRITNIMGQTLLQGTINTDIQQINIESLPAGLYFLNVGNTTQKFMKQ